MAQARDILIHVDVEVAEKRRKCHHSRGKHSIAQGTPCLTVRHPSYNSHKNYCPQCAAPIIAAARARLDQMAQAVGLVGATGRENQG